MNPVDDKQALVRRDMWRRLDHAAKSLDNADFVHEMTRNALFERLRPIIVDAEVVVDLGAATGGSAQALSRLYRRARIIPVDLSRQMLAAAQHKKGWFSKQTGVQADAARMPFADQSIDVIFSNLMLPWINDSQAVFSEVSRTLRKGGLFSFATLGPDSFGQLRRAWNQVDPGGRHVALFSDMHDLGDGLVRAGLADPVLDVDRLTISYSSPARLFRDLTMTGARNSLSGRKKSLFGKRKFRELREALEGLAVDGAIPVDLELVYGHCWGSGRAPAGDEVRLDAGQIPIRRR